MIGMFGMVGNLRQKCRPGEIDELEKRKEGGE